MLKLLEILTIILTIISTILCQKLQCDKESNSADLRVTNYFLIAAPNRKFPTNQNELNTFCKTNPSIESKIESYNKNCLNNLTKRLANLLLYSIKRTNANICRSRRRSSDFTGLGKCANIANKDNRKCWQSWLNSLNGVSLVKEHKLKMPLSCCVTYTMKSCFTQNYENNRNQCSQKTIEGLDNMFGSYVTDTMALVCGDYAEDNDKCETIVKKIPAIKDQSVSSPIEILSKIFNSFPDDEV